MTPTYFSPVFRCWFSSTTVSWFPLLHHSTHLPEWYSLHLSANFKDIGGLLIMQYSFFFLDEIIDIDDHLFSVFRPSLCLKWSRQYDIVMILLWTASSFCLFLQSLNLAIFKVRFLAPCSFFYSVSCEEALIVFSQLSVFIWGQ